MNHDQEKNPADGPAAGPAIDPALEARVVAWVAGEASAFEAAELERLVAAQPELEIFRRRMAFMHRLVSEAAKPDAAPQRLAPERRAALLATLGGTASAAAETPASGPLELPLLGARQKGWRLHRWLAAGTAAAACLAVGLIVISGFDPFEPLAKRPTRPTPADTVAQSTATAPVMAESVALAMPAPSDSAPAMSIQMPALEPRSENDPANMVNQQRQRPRIVFDEQIGPAVRGAIAAAPKNESVATERALRPGVSFSGDGIVVDDATKDFRTTTGGGFNDRALQPSSASATTITTADRSALVWGSGNFHVATGELLNFQAPIGGAVLNKVGGATTGPASAPGANGLSSGGRVLILADGSIRTADGANLNTQNLFLSTLKETGDFAFTTSGDLRFSRDSHSTNAIGAGRSSGSVSSGSLDTWAGSVTVNNVTVSGDMLNKSDSGLNIAGAGGPTTFGGDISSGTANGSLPQGRTLTVGSSLGLGTTITVNSTSSLTTGTLTTAGLALNASQIPGDTVVMDRFVVSTDRDAGYAAVSSQAAPLNLFGLSNFTLAKDPFLFGDRAARNSETASTGGSDLAFLRGEVVTVASAKPAQSFAPASDAITLSAFEVRGDTTSRARREAPAPAKAKAEEDKPVARPAPQRVVPPTDIETTAAREPASTFSLHVGEVSFRLAQAALMRGERPDPARIRAEEFYNTFDYADPAPSGAEKIASRIEQAAHPVLPQRNLVRIAVKVGATGRAAQVPLRLTVLLDTSGSMEREDRAATVRRALASLTALLGPADRVTLIGFARTPRLLAEALPGDQARSLARLAAGVPAEGGTNLEEALKLAGDLARRHRTEGAQNRIVLLTDGAANLGAAVPAQLTAMIAGLRREGIALDACGVGLDGLDDEMLEALTRQGDGRYTVLNTPEDADAEFAKKLAGTFRPAAENVKLQVRFNPARVGAYRLVGFESRRMSAEDFRNDAVDAAELAAEEAAVALYQVEVLPQGEGEVGEVFVRFRDPAAGGAMVERSWPIAHEPRAPAFARASPTLKLAAVSALLAEKLRGGTLAGQFKLGELTPTMNMLRVHYAGVPRVEELARMFTQARQLTRE